MRRSPPMAGPLVSSKLSYAGDTWTLRWRSPSRNRMVASSARVRRMLGAPRSRSAHARRGTGGARRLQTPAPPGVAALSVGVGSSGPPHAEHRPRCPDDARGRSACAMVPPGPHTAPHPAGVPHRDRGPDGLRGTPAWPRSRHRPPAGARAVGERAVYSTDPD